MTTKTFTFTGANQSFVVPAQVKSITFELQGAAGGNAASGACLGAVVKGTLTVTPGETLTLQVGGTGGSRKFPGDSTRVPGGWPNGGAGGTAGSSYINGAGGGGATSILRGTDRVVVAGGGGGEAYTTENPSSGGAGGPSLGTDTAAGDGESTSGANGGKGAYYDDGTNTVNAGAGGAGSTDGGAGSLNGQGGLGGNSTMNGGGGGGGGFAGGGGGGGGIAAGGGGGCSYWGAAGTTVSSATEGSGGPDHGLITITYNDPPATPTNLKPSGTTGKNAQQFSATVSDPNGGNVYAQFQYSLDNTNWTTVNGSTVASGSNSLKDITLTENKTYYLRARAVDPSGAVSAYTATQTFTTNRPPTAPGAFVSPTSGEKVNTTDIVEAGASSDPDGHTLAYRWDLTLDNGATWLTKRHDLGISWTYDYTNEAATTAAKWRVRAYDGLAYGPFTYSPLFTVEHNQAPTAPTPTEPVGNATKDNTKSITLKATFNDPDTNDSVSESRWRTRLVGSTTWAEVVQNSNLRYYTYAAGHFAAGDYEWQALYKDAAGAASPWSASEFFKAATPPAGPSITTPADGAVVPQNTVVGWTSTDQAAFRVRRVRDNAGVPDETTVYYDSGRVPEAAARNHPLNFETNNRYEHIQVQVESAVGLLSVWASVRALVSYTPPRLPTMDVVPEPVDARIRVAIRNPAKSNLLPDDAAATFEDGTVGGWTGNLLTLANSTAWAADRDRSLQATPTAVAGAADSHAYRRHDVGASVPLTVSATVRLAAALSGALDERSRKIVVYAYDAASAVLAGWSSVAADNAAGETRLVVTETTPANTAFVMIRLYHGGGTGAGDLWWDAIQVEHSLEVTPFHPPSTPPVVSNDLWRQRVGAGNGIRIAAGLTPAAVYLDHTPASGVDYEYQAVAFGDNNTSSTGDWFA